MSVHLVGTIVNQALVETLGWILLHSVWQLTVVAGLVLIADRLLRKAPSSSHYLLQMFALMLMCGCPVVTWLQMPELSDSLVTRAPEEGDLLTKMEPGDAVLAAAGVDGSMLASDASLKDSRAIAAVMRPSSKWREQIPVVLRPWLGTMVVAWSIGVLVFSLRPITGWVSVYRLRTRGTSAVPQSVHETLRELCARLQIRRRVDVMASTVVSSPVVIGCFRSLILLPASFAASVPVSQLEAILAHELAHVRRYDYFVNLLQTLMETLFFYHPAVWWLSHRIRIEREHCCDDLVVNVLNNRVDYGRALLAVEEYRTQFMTLAMNVGGGSLLARVRRILAVRRDDARQGTSGVLAFVGLLVCTLAGLSWSAAVAGSDEATVAANDEQVEKGAASTENSRSDERSVSAVLTENLSVELLAIHEHRQSTEEDRKSPVAPKPVWRGNGEVYTVPPELPPWLDTSHRYAEGARHVLFRVKGLSANQHVGCRADGIRFVMNPDETGVVRAVVEPGVSSSTTSFRLGVTDVDWGPWIKVDPEGQEQEGVEIPAACRDVYNRIGVSHINLRGGESQFVWLGLRGVDDTAQSSLVAVDKDGKRWPMSAASFEGSPAKPLLVEIFNVPPRQLDHFEFRLRPYRHWVTIEDVSLKPGHKTTPRVKVETVPVADLKAAIQSDGTRLISDVYARHENLAQVFADAKKSATEKQQRIAIIVAKPDSDQARWFHALLRGTAEDRDHIAVDEESLKMIRDAIQKFHVLWLDVAQFDELKKLIPDHEFEEQHQSSMVFLESDGSWLCHFEPDVKNEPQKSLKSLKSALEVHKEGK
ncbi:MAG: M56 family metallopeptidase [Planctomycetaceae bacterium]|nr:M56 family metallopeptidase [Planctomycetaceae bacterium]